MTGQVAGQVACQVEIVVRGKAHRRGRIRTRRDLKDHPRRVEPIARFHLQPARIAAFPIWADEPKRHRTILRGTLPYAHTEATPPAMQVVRWDVGIQRVRLAV